MNPKYLIFATSAIFLVFSIWCFVDGFRISPIEFAGAFTYLLLFVLIIFKVRYSRHFAFIVLAIHIAFTAFVLYWAVKGDAPTPQEIEALIQNDGRAGISYVFMTESRKRFLIVRELAILLALVFCVYALANSAVANLFKAKST